MVWPALHWSPLRLLASETEDSYVLLCVCVCVWGGNRTISQHDLWDTQSRISGAYMELHKEERINLRVQFLQPWLLFGPECCLVHLTLLN